VRKVYKIVFSGRYAVEEEKEVLYVTERAVFRLTPSCVELVRRRRAWIWKETC
jgi:propionate CoA-transferase